MRAFATHRRAGRPRSERPLVDHGTPELRRHKAAIVGVDAEGRPNEMQHSEHPLGVLMVRFVIEPREMLAGYRYEALARRVLGKKIGPELLQYERLLADASETETTPTQTDEEARALYRTIVGALKQRNPALPALIDSLCIHRDARWFLPLPGGVEREISAALGIVADELARVRPYVAAGAAGG